jgi:hypothetical protein
VGVFVDKAAQDRFSADAFAVDVGYGGAGSVRFVVGDALAYTLVARILSGCKTDIKGVIAKRAARSEGQTSPTAASGVAYVARP